MWKDADWLARRLEGAGRRDRPMSIYEVHLGSWRRDPKDPGRLLTYRELAPLLADYAVEMGFTHVEVMPLAEHPFEGSWGYQVTGFYAPTQRYGTPEDFSFFVDHLHQRGLGLILDWVPAHFPRDAFALADFDGTHLYDHADPRQGAHMDWGTLIFNYGRNEVRCFLVANALAWCDRYHIDGLRVDAVASMLYLDYSRKAGEWIPNKFGGRENLEAIAFLRETNDLVHRYFPGVLMIAEESTSFPGVTKPVKDGGLGFDFKWNMGWMHDTLQYFQSDPIHRKWHQRELTLGCSTSIPRISCLYCPMTRWSTGRHRCCSRWAPATSTARRPTSALCMRTCGHGRARSCFSWVGSSGSRQSGTTRRLSIGDCVSTWTMRGSGPC